jgi:hypothetical protein
MSWRELPTQPYAIDPGGIYYFGMVVPGDWTSQDVQGVLTAASPAGVWNVTSIHPGAVSGMFRTYEVLGKWNGPSALVSDAPLFNVTYAAMYAWTPDTQQPTPVTVPETPPAPPVKVDWTGWIVGSAVLLSGVAAIVYLRPRLSRLGLRTPRRRILRAS